MSRFRIGTIKIFLSFHFWIWTFFSCLQKQRNIHHLIRRRRHQKRKWVAMKNSMVHTVMIKKKMTDSCQFGMDRLVCLRLFLKGYIIHRLLRDQNKNVLYKCWSFDICLIGYYFTMVSRVIWNMSFVRLT